MGTASQSIRTTEDRDLFAIACKEIGESICESIACASVAVCIDADDKQEYPVTIFVKSIVLKKTPLKPLMLYQVMLSVWRLKSESLPMDAHITS